MKSKISRIALTALIGGWLTLSLIALGAESDTASLAEFITFKAAAAASLLIAWRVWSAASEAGRVIDLKSGDEIG